MACYKPQQRYVLAIMLFFSLVVSLSLRYNLSIVITQMVNVPNANNHKIIVDESICPIANTSISTLRTDSSTNDGFESKHNETWKGDVRGKREKFQWSQKLQGIILSSYFWGYIVLQLPGGILVQKFGGKYILCGGIFLSAILSFLTPWAIDVGGANGLIVIRVLMGLCQGPVYPSLSGFIAVWIPIKERGRISSVVYTGSSAGSVFATYMSGSLLSHYDNWDVVFYFFGCFTLIWCILFIVLCYSEPASHPFIDVREKEYLIEELKARRKGENDRSTPSTPWTSILTSAPVLALIWASSCYDWSYHVVTTDLPKYMNDVVHVSIQKNSIYSALPRVISLSVALTAGCVCDWMVGKRDISITNARRTFIFLASIIPAFFLLGASYGGCNELLVVTMFMIAIGAGGLMSVGTVLNPLDLSPVFASTLTGIINGIGTLTGIIAPYVVGLLTPNSLLIEWRRVFWITFAVHISEAAVFTIWGSGCVQPWDSNEKKKKNDDDSNIVKYVAANHVDETK